MSLALILIMLPSTAKTEASTGVYTYAGIEDNLVALLSDRDTSNAPSDFGTSAKDGYVWTDKTVYAASDGDFSVKLSALSQEYIHTDVTTNVNNVSADVVLVLDITGSMLRQVNNNNTATAKETSRAYFMVQAANDAIHTVLSANENNRVMVVAFTMGGSGSSYTPTATELMSLGHYTLATDDAKDYLSISETLKSGSISASTVSTNSTMKKDNVIYASQSASVTSGTTSQYGVAYACD